MKAKRLKAALSISSKENVTEEHPRAELVVGQTVSDLQNEEILHNSADEGVMSVECQTDYLQCMNEKEYQLETSTNDEKCLMETSTNDKKCQTEEIQFKDQGCQTDYEMFESHTYKLQTANKMVQATHLPFDHDDMNDDKKVKDYTGLLNFGTLMLLINFLLPEMKTVERSLTHFQQLMMVLLKLSLNLEENDLAYRFNVSQSTVSGMFKKWISYMGEKLASLICWLRQIEIRKTLQMAFRNFFSKVCVYY